MTLMMWIGMLLFLLVALNLLLVLGAWLVYHDLGESLKQKYFWRVYIGLPSAMLSSVLAATAGLFVWCNWWAPLLTGFAAFIATLIFGIFGCLIASIISKMKNRTKQSD